MIKNVNGRVNKGRLHFCLSCVKESQMSNLKELEVKHPCLTF